MELYKQTLEYLFTKLPMFQRSGPVAYKNSLDNTIDLDKVYNHPHKNFKTIHIAGTNGKGSVSHMLAAILQTAGYKTGLYTSPHLKDFRERIKINGQCISEEAVVEWVKKYREKNEGLKIEPSFFELTVAMAFDYFSQQHVDIAIVEVGLGGRLDSTNIITPEVSVITNIGLDHILLLGDTLEKIAVEKAGIIKTGVPVVIGETHFSTKNIFTDRAIGQKADIYFADQIFNADYSMVGLDGRQVFNVREGDSVKYSNLAIDLLGLYQRKNVLPVLKTIEILQENRWDISKQDIYRGLSEISKLTGILGRWQILGNNPLVVCDTGHNLDGIKAVVEQINNTAYKKLHVVFGMVNDKELETILQLLPQHATYYFTNAQIPRSLNANLLKEKAFNFGLVGEAYSAVSDAFEVAKFNAKKNDLIFIGGSTFVVAEIL